MSINVNDKNLGHATAYAYYKAGGGTMTEAEFTEFMADFGTASQTAVEAAQAALASKNAAQTAATTATNKASEATTAATTATTKAAEAQADADAAALDASQALSAASTATTKASEATTAAATATSAKTDAVAANTAAQSAKTAAQTAQTGAETAAASVAESAAQIQTNAEDISQLKSEITDKSDTADMLKAFLTDTASGSVASFADGANVPVKSLIVNIDPVQSGSGDPSPDNVRPISGWSEVNVEHTGVNVWDEEWEVGYISVSDGQPVDGGGHIRSKNFNRCVSNTAYYYKGNNNRYVFWYDADKNFIEYNYRNSSDTATIMSPANASYFKVRVEDDTSTYNHDISINYPSTDHDYHPYDGQSINIALGQTVYGGKLDVLSGELVIDWLYKHIESVSSVSNTGKYAFINLSQEAAGYTIANNPFKCNRLKPSNYSTNYDNHIHFSNAIVIGIYVSDVIGDTIASWETWLANNPLYICYKLATPTTVQLTPYEVTALLGSNNIWADAGDSTVEYRADPTLYIGRLTEPDADMIADANIVSGQYFMVGNTLYKATANIASGATISPNVNCTRKSLSEALNELNV